MAATDADEFLAALEAGNEWEETDESDRPLGRAKMLSPEPILRAVKFFSPYLAHRITHVDSRYPDPAELWRKWRAYLDDAETKKQEILARPKAPPAPVPPIPAAAASPAKPVVASASPPSKPMTVAEVQRMLRRKGG